MGIIIQYPVGRWEGYGFADPMPGGRAVWREGVVGNTLVSNKTYFTLVEVD